MNFCGLIISDYLQKVEIYFSLIIHVHKVENYKRNMIIFLRFPQFSKFVNAIDVIEISYIHV